MSKIELTPGLAKKALWDNASRWLAIIPAIKQIESGDYGKVSSQLKEPDHSTITLPWQRPELKDWRIVGMNHYHIGGRRCLYVSMVWRGEKVITAEGFDDGLEVWDDLARQSVAHLGRIRKG